MIRTKTKYNKIGLIRARDYERCMSSKCHHVSNDDYYGKPFLLEEFQRENIWKPIFACGTIKDGDFVRHYNKVVIGLPSGFGKTELAAAILLTIATMEPIYNGQYGLVASSVDQVGNIKQKIETMIKLDPDWSAQWRPLDGVIKHRETNAQIIVLPNKPAALESFHFNVIIYDEMHVYKDSKIWDTGLRCQGVVPNPLAIGITTAGDERKGFLWELLQNAHKDPKMYVYWLGLDDKDNIRSKRAWNKMLVASWWDWEKIQDHMNSATSERSFERYRANRFPLKKGAKSCFNDTQLNALTRKSNNFDFDKPWTLGIDGATSGDSFAIVAYQEQKDENGNTFSCTKEWVFDEPDEETGYYKLNDIMDLIANLCTLHHPSVVGIDPNRMIVISNQLNDNYGIETVSFAQNNATMCQATSLVINLVKSKSLRIKGCPKLKQHLANTVEEEKGAYGVRFGKDDKKNKIDAAIALAIATLAYDKLVNGSEVAIVF